MESQGKSDFSSGEEVGPDLASAASGKTKVGGQLFVLEDLEGLLQVLYTTEETLNSSFFLPGTRRKNPWTRRWSSLLR